MSNVVINGLTAVHAGSNGTLTTVDVCNTPPFCQSVAYTNIAKSADSAKTATSVKINGNPACHLVSNFAQSTGDEAGSCGGVVSGTIKGMAEFITGSPNVFFEGIPAVRQTDMMVSNMKNTPPAPLQQPGAGKPPEVNDEGPNDLSETEPVDVVDWDVSGTDMHFLNGLIGMVEEDT